MLPIRLQPSNLRPLAYRILSKKHGLNLKSDALKILADYIGPKYGSEWKSPRAQMFVEDVAKLWKEQERGLFIEGDGLNDVLRELEALEMKLNKSNAGSVSHQVSVNSFVNNAKDENNELEIADRTDTLVDDVSEDENRMLRTTPMTSISPPPISETMDWKEYFKLINAYEQPLFHYNPQSKQYELSKSQSSKLSSSTVDAGIKLFSNRFNIVKDRLLRNENFQIGTYDSMSSSTTANNITSIKNLLGRKNQRFLLFGMLTLINGDWFLEDNTDKIQLDLNQTEPNTGCYYTQGNFVLCDGIYSGGLFYCSSLGHPPGERRSETLEANGNIDFLGIHANLRIDKELSRRLRLLEMELEHKIIILGSNCYLDDLRTFDALKKLFISLSQDEYNYPISIIFNGSFASSPKHSSEYKQIFNSLASLLEEFPVIAGNISLIFVPGENDLWQTSVWPKQSIPKLFGSRLSRVVRNVQWASSPTRLVYLSQEILIVRDDIGARFRRNTINFPKIEKEKDELHENGNEIDRLDALPPRVSEARKVIKTVLDQGHISPFTQQLKPVAWHLDHILSLSPIPNVLILSDPTSPSFDVTYNGCKCLNAGPLIQKRKLNYIEYNLSSRKAEIKDLYF